MHLATALGVHSAEEIDPARPLTLGPFEFGTEAAAEARLIISGSQAPPDIDWQPRNLQAPVYWSITHHTMGDAELIGLPHGSSDPLPTAIEVGLVRTIAAAAPQDHATILAGGIEIALGPKPAWERFRALINAAQLPLVGTSILFGRHTQASIKDDASSRQSRICLDCLSNSFRTSPLKFRFLELYRMVEACFLADIKAKLLSSFDSGPNDALQDALASLKSEMSQIKSLAQTQQASFEACWTAIDQLRYSNRFAAALFRKLSKTKEPSSSKGETGAALIYQIRCAVVHAGEKDLIFESYIDGDDVIKAVIEPLERAALILIGIELF